MTIDSSQGESFKVIKAPVPGSLCVHFAMYFKNFGPFKVTVKLSQFDSGMRVQKLAGLPKSKFCCEMRFQSDHAPSLESRILFGSETGRGAGAVVFVPIWDPVVMDPRVVITMSVCGCTLMMPVILFSMIWSSSIVVLVSLV